MNFIRLIQDNIRDTVDQYNDPNFIEQNNSLMDKKLWPGFIMLVKLYMIYGLCKIILFQVYQIPDQFNIMFYYYFIIGIIPPLIIIFHHYIRNKLTISNQILVQNWILILVILIINTYLNEYMAYNVGDQMYISQLILLNFICGLSVIRNLRQRLLIFLVYYLYYVVRQRLLLFKTDTSLLIVILLLTLINYFDQSFIQLSKVSYFSEQALKSVPTAVCILDYSQDEILFQNSFMSKMVSKTYKEMTLTKSIKQNVASLSQISEKSIKSPLTILNFLSHLYVSLEDVKQYYQPVDLSRSELQIDNDDSHIDVCTLLKHIIKSDKRTQGNIYNFRCQYVDDEEGTCTTTSQIVIEVRIKTQLQYKTHQSAILINLYDISTNLKSVYYKKLNQFKSKVIRSISHELRTRLGIIQGFIQVLKDGTLEEEDKKIYFQAAYNNCRIQTFIIGSIVDYNLLIERKIGLKKEQIKIKDILCDIKDLFYAEALLKKNQLILESTVDDVTIEIDIEKVKSILVHIISNSNKHTSNGLIVIKATRDQNASTLNQQIGKRQNSVSSIKVRKSVIRQDLNSSVIGRSKKNPNLISQPSLFNQTTQSNETYISIEIRDTGIGIDQDRLAYIQYLLQDDESQDKYQTDMAAGVMIGLRASNSILKFLNDRDDLGIQINSAENRGTIVNISLRVKANQSIDYQQSDVPRDSNVELEGSVKSIQNFYQKPHAFVEYTPHSLKQPPNASARKQACQCEQEILIVDDEPYNLLVLQALLKKLSQTVIKANDGKEAFIIMEQRIKAAKYHKCRAIKAILMDYQMPVLNGEESTKDILELYQESQMEAAPIFGLTGFSSQDDVNRLLRAGMSEVFIKPVQLNNLETILLKIQKGEFKKFLRSNFSSQQQFLFLEEPDNVEDQDLLIN